jgi:preprotein translocase subunit SecB
MLSPLELKQATLGCLEVRVSDSWDMKPLVDDPCKYDYSLDVDVRKRRNQWGFRVSLDVTFKPKEGDVCRLDCVRVALVGLFHLPDDTDKELVEKLVPLNCYAILYGIARGTVAQATGMVPGGPFMLPAVNFVETLKQKKKREPKEEALSEAGSR